MPRATGYLIAIGALHVLGTALLLLNAWGSHGMLLGMGVLAYTLGLRHAFDVDHIAAIDNTTRRLVQQRNDALGVGFYFSLGHSTVVFVMTVAAAFVARWAALLPALRSFGGAFGTAVSGAFLLAIGAMNLLLWLQLYRARRAATCRVENAAALDRLLSQRGFIARIAAPLLDVVADSRGIYPVGVLFGLGFDTASEVALLAIAAAAAASSVPVAAILALPLLFAAGTTLVDTLDGIFMVKAYGWAMFEPSRKLTYNLTVTGISVLAALAVGSVEIVQVTSAGRVGDFDTALAGCALVLAFGFVWLAAAGARRFARR
jgi:nickel/cobalt transporter (NiCoT) family protein